MVILGIDPGTATTGFGIIRVVGNSFKTVDYGVITTPPGIPMEQRLVMIYEQMNQIIDTWKPDQVAIEELYFNQNVTTGITVGQARGVLLLSCAQKGLPVYEYTPLQVKQAVVGYGRAEKKQVMDMVKRICNLPAPPKPDDAADAVALALCHARSSTSLLNRGGNNACSTT